MLQVVTDERCSASMADLRDHHTVIDLLDYVDMLLFIGDA